MLELRAKVDVADLVLKLPKGEKRLAFDVEQGINETAGIFQGSINEHVSEVFTVRKASFLFGVKGQKGGAAAKITTFASVRRVTPFAIIEPDPKKKGFLLPMFEHSVPRPLPAGQETTAVPITGTPSRPTKASSIPKDYTLKGLGLHKRKQRGKKRRPGSEDEIVGKHNTFEIKRSAKMPEGGILQRISKDDVIPIRIFERGVMLDGRLHFEEIGRQVAGYWLPKKIEEKLRLTMAREGLS